jgi:hypothetical protein
MNRHDSLNALMDPSWRKSRIAARILLRKEAGTLTPRDRRLAPILARDNGVTDRLIEQALTSFRGRKANRGN